MHFWLRKQTSETSSRLAKMVKKGLFCRSYPLDAPLFEVSFHGSWHCIDHLTFKDGTIYVDFYDHESKIEEEIHGEDLRLRSREACTLDCILFLRPGIDVCVTSTNKNSVLRDCRIISIERKPHGGLCDCLFSVRFYKSQNKKMELQESIYKVTIENIAILQKLQGAPSEDGSLQWNCSKDSASIQDSELLRGMFGSEISWLLVMSTLQRVDFEISLIGKRISYCIKNDGQYLHSAIDAQSIYHCDEKKIVVVFQRPKKISKNKADYACTIPKLVDISSGGTEIDSGDVLENESKHEMLYDLMNLRRSKRAKLVPSAEFSLKPNGMSKRVPGRKRNNNKKVLCNARCKEMIGEYIKSIKLEMENQFPLSSHMEANDLINLPEREVDFSWTPSTDVYIEQTEHEDLCKEMEFALAIPPSHQEGQTPDQEVDFNWTPSTGVHIEKPEHEDLWKEMEYALATLPSHNEIQELSTECSRKTSGYSTEDDGQPCQHVYLLNEEVGIVCQICKFVRTEIRYMTPSFLQNDSRIGCKRQTEIELVWREANNFQSDSLRDIISFEDSSVSVGNHNIWTPIPGLIEKLHLHQKRAFEFLWRNIAEKNNGCILSHTPGAGKTLVVISFLASYLRMFPGHRPLILCPKIALYVWCKEFEKWEVPIPVHKIESFAAYRKDLWRYQTRFSLLNDFEVDQKTMHAMHCLQCIKSWHEQPSILLMSYSSFLSLARVKSSFEHKRFLAKVLLKSPGILVLDEGHNPRSSRSKLRKQIMKVSTNLRILLSGTLFQNNFEEYFNTLCLARPRFMDDLICELNSCMISSYDRKENASKLKIHKEELSRKLFVQEIGNRIRSRMKRERTDGFKLLMNLTAGFLDVYTGENSDKLPGLLVYTVVLNPTDAQNVILLKLQQLTKHNRRPLELELLVTFASIHPWLIRTATFVSSYFSEAELEGADQSRCKFWEGSKLKFIVDIVHKSTTVGEKVLIFCHYISPINFLLESLEIIFGWRKGEEMLVITGDQDLFERSKVLDKFKVGHEEPAKVLVASTTACAESISLTAASRVILLDSEWNHSKTNQAIGRAFRPGQLRVVYVYQLLAAGTCEENKYCSNEWKERLSKMVILGKYIKQSLSSKKVDEIEDDMLRDVVKNDQGNTILKVMRRD